MLSALRTRKNHRRAGDAARARGDWVAAEESYRKHLEQKPGDAAIWVQLGHAAKEQDRIEPAIAAYRRATDLLPNDAEVWLHLAHALVRDERESDALHAFERSHSLDGGKESFDHALSLDAKPKPLPAPDRPATTFLLLDDLLSFLKHHVTLSGIQRTQVGIIASLLQKDASAYRFLLTSDDRKHAAVTCWEMPSGHVKTLVEYAASGTDMERATLDGLLKKIHRESRRAAFRAGDVVFITGAFWIMGKTAATLAMLKSQGVKIGVYVYDLIPISHPEFCYPHLVETFARAFTEMVQFADFYATISDYVAGTLTDFIRDHDLRPVPVTVVPLAHFLTMANPDQDANQLFMRNLPARVRQGAYALYVSTIEGRKNHLFVLQAWQELIRSGIDVPDLVFLGRKGMRVEGLTSFLDATHDLNGRVHIMHDIGDGDLAYLYRNCQFTLFTSFVEGWGLPVGESLVFGKPCVASNTCSIPEVGGDLLDYVDPFNLRSGIEVIGRLITDPEYREQRGREITKSFRPRTWPEVGTIFADMLRQAHAMPVAAFARFAEAPGENVDLCQGRIDLTDLNNLLKYPSYLMLQESFYEPEPGQTWMRGTSGVIEVPTTLAPGDIATVAVGLVMAPWSNHKARVAVSPVGTDEDTLRRSARVLVEHAGVALVATVEAPVDADGVASVQISVFDPPAYTGDEGRDFYVGVRSIAYGKADAGLAPDSLLATFVDNVPFAFDQAGAGRGVRG